jgi:hypothetical protein
MIVLFVFVFEFEQACYSIAMLAFFFAATGTMVPAGL